MQRPTRRSECRNGQRPCPWVCCRYALPGPEETCALDVSERLAATGKQLDWDEVAELLDSTPGAVAEVARVAIRKIQQAAQAAEV